MKITLNEAIDYIKSEDDFYILTHRYPDGDTLGSAFALYRILKLCGKRARVLCSDEIPKKYDYLHDDITPEEFEPKCIIAVDVADTKLLGKPLMDEYSERVDLCIDHHISNLEYSDKLLLDGQASAAGEIIFDMINEMGLEVTTKFAEAVYTAISTDTGCFKFSNVTPKTLRIAAQLMEVGIDTQKINRLMFDNRSKEKIALEVEVLKSLRYDLDGRCAAIFITKDMIEKTGAGDDDIEGFASIPRAIEGVDWGITFRQSDTGFKISLRTNPPTGSASDICGKLGGGGHAAAAGCFVKGDAETAYKTVIDVIRKSTEV